VAGGYAADEATALSHLYGAMDMRAPPALAALGRGETSVADLITAGGTVDLRPTRDAAPYFFALKRGLPGAAQQGAWVALGVGVAIGTYVGAALLHPRARPWHARGDPTTTR
jgi:hypothetical protein